MPISNEVFFVDWNSLKAYEAYLINNVQVVKFLGQFQDNIDKNINTKFIPSEYYLSPMAKRRKNFHGLELNGIIAGIKTETLSRTEVEIFSENNKIYYDVTKLKTNPQMFHNPIF